METWEDAEMVGNMSLKTSISPRYFMYSLLQTKEMVVVVVVVVVV